jgi:3-deoxy-manno-octulosonate cytidylyltransferase (CMP-KDO synthetase)
MKKIEDSTTLFDPNKVKVISDLNGRALYFSRQAIPFAKGIDPEKWIENGNYFKHLGLYAYKSEALRQIASLQPSSLEISESLEQLRWLENGKNIYLAETGIETPAVDTPADLEALLSGHGADL